MSKHHNWPTGKDNPLYDLDVDRAARLFLANCGHLTPVKQDELDTMLADMAPPQNVAPETCEPDKDVLAALNAPPEPRWEDEEPSSEAYEFDDARVTTDVVSE